MAFKDFSYDFYLILNISRTTFIGFKDFLYDFYLILNISRMTFILERPLGRREKLPRCGSRENWPSARVKTR